MTNSRIAHRPITIYPTMTDSRIARLSAEQQSKVKQVNAMFTEQADKAREQARRAGMYDELVEALKAVMADLHNLDTDSHISPIVGRKIRAAINHAEGKTP